MLMENNIENKQIVKNTLIMSSKININSFLLSFNVNSKMELINSALKLR